MPRESKSDLKRRAAKIVAALKKAYPQAGCSLDHGEPMELLVATILSAQCTDVRVNVITKELFRKYRTVRAYAEAAQEQMEDDVRTAGFYRNKAKAIRGSAAMIIEHFGGKVPDTMEGLLSLPGVARKTANVVLSNAFGKSEGVVVDTHVARIAVRLKLTRRRKSDAVGIEKDLMSLIPRGDWALVSHLLIFHGRAVCRARKPNCCDCPLGAGGLCPSAGKV